MRAFRREHAGSWPSYVPAGIVDSLSVTSPGNFGGAAVARRNRKRKRAHTKRICRIGKRKPACKLSPAHHAQSHVHMKFTLGRSISD